MNDIKYGLLAVSTEDIINIGDYVQALASSQFLPRIDSFVERECLKEYDGEDLIMIMNGWYMHNPNHWPPSNKIHPLFVAFHINNMSKKELLSKKSVDYIKQYEPIGCRDVNTVKLLEMYDVKAYFSGCMTLTLGYKFHSKKHDNNVCFVDPPYNKYSVKQIFPLIYKSLFPFLMNVIDVLHLSKKMEVYDERKYLHRKLSINFIFHILEISLFYTNYRKVFTEETLLSATYITHFSRYYNENFHSNNELLNCAEQLLNKYMKAGLVVTSRIHCALPCLAIGTPVIYIHDENQDKNSTCRLGGLMDFFNVMYMEAEKFHYDFKTPFQDKISITNIPINKTNWKPYAEKLIKCCKDFFSKYENN